MTKIKYQDLTNRNIGILTKSEQNILRKATVVIAGVGGVGGLVAERLVRIGIEKIKIADPQTYDATNLNRQFASSSKTIGKNKAKVVAKLLKEINPNINIEIYSEGITAKNIQQFVKRADIVVDGVDDKAFKEETLLCQAARAQGLYVVTAYAMGFGTNVFIFSPKGMTFEEYFELPQNEEGFKKYTFPYKKICPTIPSSISLDIIKKIVQREINIPTLSISCSFAASAIIVEVLSLLLKKKKPIVVPDCVILDFLKKELVIYKGAKSK